MCGSGNNGGDGFVIANHLADDSKVTVLFLGTEEKLSEEAKANYDKVKNNALINLTNDLSSIKGYDVVIDAYG